MPIETNKMSSRTDYVVEIAVELENSVETNVAEDSEFQLVDIEQFKIEYNNCIKGAKEGEAAKYWHSLFGNDSSSPIASRLDHDINTQARYLTKSSCDMILKFHHQFKHGIDFQHLPKGFFIAKNPAQQGVREVLHYSDYVAKNITGDWPLSITLTEKQEKQEEKEEKEDKNIFEPPQDQWYEFLRSKRQGSGGVYCTEKELRSAFIEFSKTIGNLKLSFFEENFKNFSGTNKGEDFNPIILLGRWSTIMSNPHLKKEDREMQWRNLPRLNVANGFSPIRAITDYQYTRTPCGFILPEMFLYGRHFAFVRPSVDAPSLLNFTDTDFWCHIAFKAKRNSIEFYQKGIDLIGKIKGISLDSSRSMQAILLNSTTAGEGHLFKLEENEAVALGLWEEVCSIIESAPTNSLLMRVASRSSGMEKKFKEDFIRRLASFGKFSIEFLYSATKFIDNFLSSISIVNAGNSNAEQELDTLTAEVLFLIKQYDQGFHSGYRFYLVDKKLPKDINAQKYCKLQISLHEKLDKMLKQVRGQWPHLINSFGRLRAAIIQNLSTFNFRNEKDIERVDALLGTVNSLWSPPGLLEGMVYCLNIFNDVTSQLTLEDLGEIISAVKSIAAEEEKAETKDKTSQPMPLKQKILSYIEKKYENFPKGYFDRKRKELEQGNKKGLTDLQAKQIRELRFSPVSTEHCLSIASELVQNGFSPESINEINESLLTLSNILTPEDFELFLNKIDKIKKYLASDDPLVILQFLNMLITRRTLNAFNQIYASNEREKCHDKSLLTKFMTYTNDIVPLCKHSNVNFIKSIKIQELLAEIVLNTEVSTFNIEAIKQFIGLLENTYKNQPHTIEILIELVRSLPDKKTEEYAKRLTDLQQCISTLHKILPSGENEDGKFNMLLFFSILEKFRSNPDRLMGLIRKLENFKKKRRQKIFVISC